MLRTRYAMQKIDRIEGIKVLFPNSHHFREFVVNFDGAGKEVVQINRDLLASGIYGGKDLSLEFPNLGNSALYCVTEVHSRADIDRLVDCLVEVIA